MRFVFFNRTCNFLYWQTFLELDEFHDNMQLEQKFAAETAQLNPPHRFVPWVLVNNQPIQEVCPHFKSPFPFPIRVSTMCFWWHRTSRILWAMYAMLTKGLKYQRHANLCLQRAIHFRKKFPLVQSARLTKQATLYPRHEQLIKALWSTHDLCNSLHRS